MKQPTHLNQAVLLHTTVTWSRRGASGTAQHVGHQALHRDYPPLPARKPCLKTLTKPLPCYVFVCASAAPRLGTACVRVAIRAHTFRGHTIHNKQKTRTCELARHVCSNERQKRATCIRLTTVSCNWLSARRHTNAQLAGLMPFSSPFYYCGDNVTAFGDLIKGVSPMLVQEARSQAPPLRLHPSSFLLPLSFSTSASCVSTCAIRSKHLPAVRKFPAPSCAAPPHPMAQRPPPPRARM